MMLLRKILAGIGLALLLGGSPALAQDATYKTPGGQSVDGKVEMCLNGSSQAVPCSATSPLTVGAQPYNYTAVTGAQYGLTIAASTALTVPATALQAQVCASGNSVKYTSSGTTPTASVGMPLAIGQCMQFSGATFLAALRFIQTGATATLDVEYTK